jgi:glycosyltransferase involved in cell wall biosynthesis
MIDIVMPTYNRANALRKTIDSYMNQEFLGKFILLDDCSTDDTPEFAAALAEKYPGKIIYHRESKKTTTPYLRNIGVGLSHAEYIFMGEDDVYLPPDHFTVLLEKMNELGADIIGGRRINLRRGQTNEQALAIANCDRQSVLVTVPFEQYFERFIDAPLMVPAMHSNSLIKRSIFETVSYDPEYGGNAFREETDFFLRAFGAGFKLVLIPDTIIYHLKNTLVNNTGGSRKKRLAYEWQVWKNSWRFFIKNKDIFTKKLGVKNIYIYAVLCILARYPYALKRRHDYRRYKKMVS